MGNLTTPVSSRSTPSEGALKCGLQGARSPLRVPIVLGARLLEPPCTTRMHGRAGGTGPRGSAPPDPYAGHEESLEASPLPFRVRGRIHTEEIMRTPISTAIKNIALSWRIVVRRARAPRNAEILLMQRSLC
jgi:hypothetical protein